MNQIKAFRKQLSKYFSDYGGWRAVLGSPFFLIAVALSLSGYGNWTKDSWSSLSQALLPNLLGFSLGTYAILLSMLTGRLKAALKAVPNERGVAYLNEMNATFFHFIIVQVISLLWAIAYNGTLLNDLVEIVGIRFEWVNAALKIASALGGFVGYSLLLYSISLAIASAIVVYRLASIVDPSSD